MTMSKLKMPVGRSLCLWANKTQSTYTAKITLHNPKPLPATVQYWAGQWAEKVSGKPSVKIPAKQDSRIIELEVLPGESLCVFTDNRDIVAELELFIVHIDKPNIDISKTREAVVRVSVAGAKSPVTIGPASVAKGLTVTPKEITVKPREQASFKIEASDATDSIRKVRFGILDRATSASGTVVADCRKMIRETYRAARDESTIEPTAHAVQQTPAPENDIIAGMKSSYFKTHPAFVKK